MKVIKYLILLMIVSFNAWGVTVKMPSHHTLRVIYQAAHHFGVDADTLIKIAYVESRFDATAERVNGNGSIDYGMFQINSVHWSKDCKHFNVLTLRGNALCAAKLLRVAKRHAADRFWIGRYHSTTLRRKRAYYRLVSSIVLAKGE